MGSPLEDSRVKVASWLTLLFVPRKIKATTAIVLLFLHFPCSNILAESTVQLSAESERKKRPPARFSPPAFLFFHQSENTNRQIPGGPTEHYLIPPP